MEKVVTTALRSKEKLGFINGTFTLKTDAEQAEKDAWDIKKRYGSSNIPKKHSLKTKIANCKQGEGMSVIDYYSKLVGYWNELDGVAKRYFCHCGKCECKILWPNIIKEAEEEKTHQFLMGLDMKNMVLFEDIF